MRSALVIGGSGPTGPFVVDGLLARGWRVTMLHSGTHKPQRAWYMDGTVEVLLASAFDEADLARVLSGRCFELGVVMYGQLRTISRLFKDASTVQRLVAVGGVPVYRGFGTPRADEAPFGMLVGGQGEDDLNKNTTDRSMKGSASAADFPTGNIKINRIVQTEQALFSIWPDATLLRYPWIYGEHPMSAYDFMVVKRVLDERDFIVLPDGGLTLMTRCFAENAAHAVLLCVDRPDVAKGQEHITRPHPIHTPTCKHARTHARKHTGARLHARTHARTHANTQAHACTHVRTHARTHANTQARARTADTCA
jgi:nucleoside-diphosphate-sugar epimerase